MYCTYEVYPIQTYTSPSSKPCLSVCLAPPPLPTNFNTSIL